MILWGLSDNDYIVGEKIRGLCLMILWGCSDRRGSEYNGVKIGDVDIVGEIGGGESPLVSGDIVVIVR